MITQSRIKELLNYDAETGIFTWKVARAGNAKFGYHAGTKNKFGHIRIQIDGKLYFAHKLASIYMTGEYIQRDHKNLDPSDNSWSNLRKATQSQNLANIKKPIHNKTGLKGVSICKQTGKFRSSIQVNGKCKNLGRYNCPAVASFKYQIEADKAFGEFARW